MRITSMSTQPEPPIIEATGVAKSYGDRAILRGIDLSLAHGERLALTGPSGSGKTTLLNCLGGVDRHDGGSIRLGGTVLESLTNDQLADLRRRRIGTVFQFFHLLPTLNAFENIELPLQLIGIAAGERRERVAAMIERVGIAHRSEATPDQMSGGEMQRVAIARALVHRPTLILADEPTGNLDSRNGAIVLRMLQDLTEETGTGLLLVTHSEEAARICHRTLHLVDGAISEVIHG
ncbi:MAG: ABC transporter ATP-binding protein [Opitutaceae bacterium]